MNKSICPLFTKCRLLALSLVLVIGANSCSSKKKVVDSNTADRSANYLLKEVDNRLLEPEWMEAKASIHFEDKDISIGGKATLRLRKDSLLWVSVRKFGLEVARAKINTDSVYVLDRINNEYAIYGLSYLAKSYGLPADFNLLQCMVLGNPYFFNRTRVRVENRPPVYILQERLDARSLAYSVAGADFSLTAIDFLDRNESITVNVALSDYKPVDKDRIFSYFRKIQVDSEETGPVKVEIKYDKVEFDVPSSMEFNIPGKYSRID